MLKIVKVGALALGLAALVSACGHSPKKAPCSREDGEVQALGFAPVPTSTFNNPLAWEQCGEMRSLNR